MKIYNKKGFLSGIFWIVLALWSIIHDFGSPNPNTLIQIRDSIISLFYKSHIYAILKYIM